MFDLEFVSASFEYFQKHHDSTLKIFTIAPVQFILEPTIGSSTIDTACTVLTASPSEKGIYDMDILVKYPYHRYREL